MKNALFMFLICLFLFSAAHAADLSQPHITVYGEAEEKVAPNRMVWYLNVTNKGTILKAVAEDHTRIVADVLTFLKKAGTPDEALQTSRMRFGENWAYRNSSRVKEGYFATTEIVFRLTEMDRYDDFWMKLSEYDHVSINTVNFEISDDEKLYPELRRRALISAKKKAERMARVLDSEIGEPLVIEEGFPASGSRSESTRMLAMDEASGGGGQSAVAPGQITLQEQVTVIYRLISPPQ